METPYNPLKPYKHEILRLIETTWNTPYIKVERGLYPTFRKLFEYSEVDHTDGIGTKGTYHWAQKTWGNAAIDALAMNLNDLLLIGAKAYKLQNHITLPKDDTFVISEIVQAIATECKKRNIAMTGGETSIHPNISGLDISMTVSGFIPERQENRLHIGDALIGIKSSGLHSNGFSLVHQLFGDEQRQEFTVPTAIYTEDIEEIRKRTQVHGCMHITGGAYTKLFDILPENADVVLEQSETLKPQEIFYQLYQRGTSDETMYKTFNCGVGFIFSCPPDMLPPLPLHMAILGNVVSGTRHIRIHSAFSDTDVVL